MDFMCKASKVENHWYTNLVIIANSSQYVNQVLIHMYKKVIQKINIDYIG